MSVDDIYDKYFKDEKPVGIEVSMYIEKGGLMKNLLKYLKLIATFRQVADEYKKDNGKDKPLVLSRRFFGLLFTITGAVITQFTGTTIFPVQMENLADSTKTIWDSIQVAYPHLIELYGIIMLIVGQIRRNK